MALTILTFNEAYELTNLINGIIHFLNTKDWQTMVFIALVLSVFTGCVQMLFNQKAFASIFLMAFLAPFVLYVALIKTKVKVNIQDEYSQEVYTLSNVPISLALPLMVFSHFELGLVKLIDEKVRPVSVPEFKEVDFLGQARLTAKVTRPEIYNSPYLIRTIADYGRNCVVPAVASGQVTPQEIQNSPNLLYLLNFGYQVFFTKIYTEDNKVHINTCSHAFGHIQSSIANTINLSHNSAFSKKVLSSFGNKANNPALAGIALETALGSMFSGYQNSSQQLFQQLFMINGLKSSLSTVDPTLGASIAEAESKQIVAQTTAGLLNIKHLYKYRTFLKLFLISILPIVACFWFFNFGKGFLFWCGLFLWISLFLPIQAAIHAIYTAVTISDLRMYTDFMGGYTISSAPSVLKWATETNAMASNVMLLIMPLAGLVIRISAPMVGQAVTSMMMASQIQQRFQAQGAMGSNQAAEARLVEMNAAQKANLALGEETSVRGLENQQFDGLLQNLSGKGMSDNLFGQDPVLNKSGGNFLENQFGGKTTLQSAFSRTSQANLSNQLSSAFSNLQSKLHSISQADSSTVTETQAETVRKAAMQGLSSEQVDAIDQSLSKGYSKLEEIGQSKGWSKDEITSSKASLKAEAYSGGGVNLGFARVGGKVTGATGSDSSISAGSNESVSESQRQALSEKMDESVSKVVAQKESLSHSNSSESAKSASLAKAQAYSDLVSEVSQASSQTSSLRSASVALQDANSRGGSLSLELTELVGQMGHSDMLRVARSGVNSQLESYWDNTNSGSHADLQNMQKMVYADVKNAAMNRDDARLQSYAQAFTASGVNNADTFTAIAYSGGQIADSVGNAVGGGISAPGLPGEKGMQPMYFGARGGNTGATGGYSGGASGASGGYAGGASGYTGGNVSGSTAGSTAGSNGIEGNGLGGANAPRGMGGQGLGDLPSIGSRNDVENAFNNAKEHVQANAPNLSAPSETPSLLSVPTELDRDMGQSVVKDVQQTHARSVTGNINRLKVGAEDYAKQKGVDALNSVKDGAQLNMENRKTP